MRQVILPEMVSLLIHEDLRCSLPAAIEIFKDSNYFGELLHPSKQESKTFLDLVRVHEKYPDVVEDHYHEWRKLGSTLDYLEWMDNEKTPGTPID